MRGAVLYAPGDVRVETRQDPTIIEPTDAIIVEEVGGAVTTNRPGQFVVGSFFASDTTCEICRAGYQSSCVRRGLIGANGTQAELARIPLAAEP